VEIGLIALRGLVGFAQAAGVAAARAFVSGCCGWDRVVCLCFCVREISKFGGKHRGTRRVCVGLLWLGPSGPFYVFVL